MNTNENDPADTGTPALSALLDGLQSHLDRLAKVHERAVEWHGLSDAGLRLRLGEMTAQEIRTVRAVLNAIVGEQP